MALRITLLSQKGLVLVRKVRISLTRCTLGATIADPTAGTPSRATRHRASEAMAGPRHLRRLSRRQAGMSLGDCSRCMRACVALPRLAFFMPCLQKWSDSQPWFAYAPFAGMRLACLLTVHVSLLFLFLRSRILALSGCRVRNIGNTCYMSAVLQSLLNLPMFTAALTSQTLTERLTEEAILTLYVAFVSSQIVCACSCLPYHLAVQPCVQPASLMNGMGSRNDRASFCRCAAHGAADVLRSARSDPTRTQWRPRAGWGTGNRDGARDGHSSHGRKGKEERYSKMYAWFSVDSLHA